MTIFTPGDVEQSIRKLLGGRMKELPGHPPLDKRDIYLRLVKVYKIYPDHGIAYVKPFREINNPRFDPYPVRLTYPFFDNNTILACTPKGNKGVDAYGNYIVPSSDVFAVALAVEGEMDKKGAYILGFVKRDDQLVSSSGTLEGGWIMEFGRAKIHITPEPSITIGICDNKIVISDAGIEISGKVYINGKEVK